MSREVSKPAMTARELLRAVADEIAPRLPYCTTETRRRYDRANALRGLAGRIDEALAHARRQTGDGCTCCIDALAALARLDASLEADAGTT